MSFGDKMLSAEGAREGSLACVSAHMRFQVAGFCELFETLLKRTVQNPLLFFRSFYFLYNLTKCETIS